MQWATSSQARRWQFTPETLEQARKDAHANSLKDPRLKELALSFEEEQVIQSLFVTRISLLITQLKGASRLAEVEATAYTFYKRFFLHHSVMEYDPKVVLATCVYLACKVEEQYVRMREVVDCFKDPTVTETSMVQMEYLLLDALGFDLMVHHPLQPLTGFILEIQEHRQEEHGALFTAAKRILSQEAIKGDISFFYPPSQIALAAIIKAASMASNPHASGIDEAVANTSKGAVDEFIAKKLAVLPQWDMMLQPNLDKIQTMFAKPEQPNMAVVKPLWKKLTDYYAANAIKDKVKQEIKQEPLHS